MQLFLITTAALAQVVSAAAEVSTVCSTSTYDIGTAHSEITGRYSLVNTYYSEISSSLTSAISHTSPFQVQGFAFYAAAVRGLQGAVSGLTSINNADVVDVIEVDAQLANLLELLAGNAVYITNPAYLGSLLYSVKSGISLENAAINKLISSSGGVSCDLQNSLNSLGSRLSRGFSAVGTLPLISNYMAISLNWAIVDSVTCPLDCSTFTVSGTDATSTDATTTSTDDTTTSSATSTSTESSTEIISSRTVSGSVQRCLVRPTATTTTTSAAITGN